LIFVAAAGFIYALVLGLNYHGFKTLFANKEGMAEGSQYIQSTYSLKGLTRFIGKHPEWVSITSYNVNDPDSGIFYKSDTPRAMGATTNLLLLMEYERQVAEGLLEPDEMIESDAINRFALPEISENNHKNLSTSFDGGKAPLDELVQAMIKNSDLVFADYLWFKLGEENIRSLIDTLQLPITALPLPFSGMYIAINPSLSDTSILKTEDFASFANRAIANATQLKNDSDYNQKVKNTFYEHRLSLSFMQERDALEYFPKATTNQLAGLMEQLFKDEILSKDISENVKKKLNWLQNSGSLSQNLENYAGIYDNRMGLLTGIDFGTSAADGHTSVQAISFAQLPVGFWLHMSANHMQEDFQRRLIWDPALYDATQQEITLHNE
jgi:beta-lactamase class A